jgi:hypothetical protein
LESIPHVESSARTPFELAQKHWENTQRFESCPLRSKTLVFPGFFAYWASSFGRL